MLAETVNVRTIVRRVADTRTLRSQPRVMQVSLPALRCLDELPAVPGLPDPDAQPGGRDAG